MSSAWISVISTAGSSAAGRSRATWLQQSDAENVVGNDRAAGIGLRVPSNTGLRGEVALTLIESNFNPALGFVRRKGIDELAIDLGHT